MYLYPIPAWIHSGNGYGKLIGETQVREFGEIETPILFTDINTAELIKYGCTSNLVWVSTR